MTISRPWSSGLDTGRKLRIPIAAMVTLSSLCGYVLYGPDNFSNLTLFLAAGIFSLAFGATLLNQVQESASDRLMVRTRLRPLASGRLSRRRGLLLSLILIIAGFVLLTRTGNPAIPALGVLSLFLYNGIYTFLKPLSNWALLPGGVCGALPPLMGWLAAGGSLPDYRIGLFMAILFLWQIPHFWFLSAVYREDYFRAGLPVILDQLHIRQFQRVAGAWMLAFSAGIAFLACFEAVDSPWSRWGLLVVAGAGFSSTLRSLFSTMDNPARYQRLFLHLNLMMAAVFTTILLDSF